MPNYPGKKSMKLVTNISITFSIIFCLYAVSASAKVSPEKAAQLGKNLTPVGAEMAGNSAGTIPDWTGGLTKMPAGFTPGKAELAPYSDDKILYTIDKTNMEQYSANLSEGQMGMMSTYDTFKMPIYPTRRSATYTDASVEMINKNAINTELAPGGNGLKNFIGLYPFPIPNSGTEVLWNHIQRNKGGSWSRKYNHVTPTTNGDYTAVTMSEDYSDRYALKDAATNKDDNLIFYFKQAVIAPARLAGSVLLVHETLDQVKEARRAWVYNAGQRRVRRAPQVSYDSPGTASDGLKTADNFDMFNGAPDRYNWELVGKQELYVPYNSFGLDNKSIKYKNLIKAGHINTEHARYELHRVWKVVATLKDGERNIYSKRVFYIDEDTWGILISNFYDGRGQLWRMAESHNKYYFDALSVMPTVETIYDLIGKRYMANGLSNEIAKNFSFNKGFATKDFTPAALRRSGRR